MKGMSINTMRKLVLFVLLLSFAVIVTPASATQEPSQPVVHAVLFYSPSCGHCQFVISETLLPLVEKYGEQLSIVGIDISTSSGNELFRNVLLYFNLESGGVPFLVYGDTFLVGSVDIPEKFPGLIDQYLTQGGIDWPSIPGITEALATSQPNPTSTNTPPSTESQTLEATNTPDLPPTVASIPTATPGLILTHDDASKLGANFTRDLQGNSLAVIVLVGMIITIGSGSMRLFIMSDGRQVKSGFTTSWSWMVIALCLIGLTVAGYLAYVETTQVEAVCGPVGDCNTVQQSQYARLFGVLPIGILGIAGYLLIMISWFVSRSANKPQAAYASIVMLGMSAFGVLFSIYLTFLEPFVIGATCAWCLASAIIMTALFWLSLNPGKAAFLYLRQGEKYGTKRTGSSRTF